MVCEHRDIARTILTIEGYRRLLLSMWNYGNPFDNMDGWVV